jgi:arsenate reductase
VNSIFAPDASKPAVLYNAWLNSAIPEWIEMTTTIYGIKNCDTMKKARAWLDSHGVAYDFHDYKTEGIAKDKLKLWSDELGWETLLNRAGTTFRKLPDADKEDLNERKAIALMLAQPSMIKRPVLDLGGRLLVGFKPEIYAKEVAPSGGARRGKSSSAQ